MDHLVSLKGRVYKPGKSLTKYEQHQIRILASADLTITDIARKTHFHEKTVSKYLQEAENDVQRGRKYKKDIMTEDVITFIEYCKDKKPTMYCNEIKTKLLENGICTRENLPSADSILKAIKYDLGYTRKKITPIASESITDEVQQEFDEFINYISNTDPSTIHFFDESSVVKTTGNRIYGCSIRGSPAFEIQKFASNANFTINLLHSRFGVDYFSILEGPSNSLELMNFFGSVIDTNKEKIQNGHPPLLVPGDTIIMDNCRFHHSQIVTAHLPPLLAAEGIRLRYQPPYHPQINSCEYCFHMIKTFLRQNEEYSYLYTELAISDAIINKVTREISENIFRKCGFI